MEPASYLRGKQGWPPHPAMTTQDQRTITLASTRDGWLASNEAFEAPERPEPQGLAFQASGWVTARVKITSWPSLLNHTIHEALPQMRAIAKMASVHLDEIAPRRTLKHLAQVFKLNIPNASVELCEPQAPQ